MTASGEREARHTEAARQAADLYIGSRTAATFADAWHDALAQARAWISAALRASNYFRDIERAIEAEGRHMRVFRHLLTPPISQDQFRLVCKDWSKATEKDGKKVPKRVSTIVAKTVNDWRDKRLTKWIDAGRMPTVREVRRLFDTIAPLLASQEFGTFERKRASKDQEGRVIKLLTDAGWTRQSAKLIDRRAELPERHFVHRTRFATGPSSSKEVDIACGLRDTYVLAMECKVTNDPTNSIKRIDDVMNKATAWKSYWGQFVIPAALLQGVVEPKEVDRLLRGGVEVFWSHDLDALKRWLDDRI